MKTIKEFENYFKGEVSQYKKAAKSVMEKGYYRRGTDFRNKNRDDLYVLIGEDVELLACNINHHRALQVINAYEEGTLFSVPEHVLNNYLTNGYNTRRGLFANYSGTEERIKRIDRSHEIITSKGELAHNIRVKLRNEF